MPTASDILDQHVTLQYRSLDRIYLNLYAPYLATSGGVRQFLERLGPLASPALFERRSKAFVDRLRTYTERHNIPWVRFIKGERKDQRIRPYQDAAAQQGRSALVAVGVAQERASSWHGVKRLGSGGGTYFSFVRRSVFVNYYYLYLWDEHFGPAFIKVCGFAPWSGKVCVNGHDWAKRQLARRGVAFEPLDNGFRSVADSALLSQVCAALGPREIEAFLARWSAELPLPLDPSDRAAGYRYRLSLMQVEVADTRVFDRPLRGRQWFEATMRDQLSLGRPAEVSLLFARQVRRTTPGRFLTRIIHEDTLPTLRVAYKRCSIKQYLKEGRALRTETTFNDSYDVDIGRSLPNLRRLKQMGDEINARLLAHERTGEEARLAGADLTDLVLPRRAGARRIPALRFGDPRVIALFAALVQQSYQAAGFRHAQLRRSVAALLGRAPGEYRAAQMTYDLARLVGHGLIQRKARSHRYQPTAEGLRIAAFLTKINDRLLTPGLARATDPGPPPHPRWLPFDRALRTLCDDAQIAA
jgi:hypothetical protein